MSRRLAPSQIIFIGLACGAGLGLLMWGWSWERANGNIGTQSLRTEWQPGFYEQVRWFDAPINVAENYSARCGGLRTDGADQFDLALVIFRYEGDDAKTQPLIYLAGGPGSSHSLEPENVESWYYWLEEAALERDLIVMDQRGTGLSKPLFECPEYSRFLKSALSDDLGAEQEYNSAFSVIEKCLQDAEAKGFSPQDYSSSKSVDDLQQLMSELAYEHWNVLGVSYGTRVALDWARRDDPGLRSLILDSVYPPEKGGLTEWPELLHKAFERFWRACRSGELCDENARDSEEKFWQALELLKKAPRELRIPLWNGGWPLDVVVNDQRFFNVVYHGFYNESVYPEIIAAIDEIVRGGDAPALQKLVEREVNSELAPEFNVLTYLAVNCGEIPQETLGDFERARAQFPQLLTFTDLAWEYDYCQLFPRRADLQKFREPVTSDLPTLILAGEFDPVTPAPWADEISAQGFSHSQVQLLSNSGHGVIGHSSCIHKNIKHFLDDPRDAWQPNCVTD